MLTRRGVRTCSPTSSYAFTYRQGSWSVTEHLRHLSNLSFHMYIRHALGASLLSSEAIERRSESGAISVSTYMISVFWRVKQKIAFDYRNGHTYPYAILWSVRRLTTLREFNSNANDCTESENPLFISKFNDFYCFPRCTAKVLLAVSFLGNRSGSDQKKGVACCASKWWRGAEQQHMQCLACCFAYCYRPSAAPKPEGHATRWFQSIASSRFQVLSTQFPPKQRRGYRWIFR